MLNVVLKLEKKEARFQIKKENKMEKNYYPKEIVK